MESVLVLQGPRSVCQNIWTLFAVIFPRITEHVAHQILIHVNLKNTFCD